MTPTPDPNGSTDPPAAAKPRPFKKALRGLALFFGAAALLVVGTAALFVALGIPVDLSGLKGRIQAAASSQLGRSVTISGPIELVPTLWPTLRIEDVRIGNPEGWPDADFLQLGSARAQLGIPPLLRGDIAVRELHVERLSVDLKTDPQGNPNWVFADAPPPEERPSADDPTEADPAEADPGGPRFVGLDELSLRDIAIRYEDGQTGQTFALVLDEVSGEAAWDAPLSLSIRGTVQSLPVSATLTAGSLADLMDAERAWDLNVAVSAAGTELSAEGVVADPLHAKGLALGFALRGPKMAEMERLFGISLPADRAFDLSGRIEEAGGAYQVTGLQGSLGATPFTGDIKVDLAGERPRLAGNLNIPSIDLQPFSEAVETAAQQRNGQAETQAPAEGETEVDIDAPLLTLEVLETFDADFAVTVGEIVGHALDAREASLEVKVAEGQLESPLKATVAGVPFTGTLMLAPDGDTISAGVALHAENSDIADLLDFVAETDLEDVQGSFQAADLSVTANAKSLRTLLQSLEMQFALFGAALSYGNAEGERPVEFTLDTFELIFPASAEARVKARGTLLREAFTLELTGGTFVQNYIDRKWPLDLKATGGGALLTVSGIVGRPKAGARTDLAFSLEGEEFGGLAPWIGADPNADLPYKIAGQAIAAEDVTKINLEEVRIGNTAFSGELGAREEAGKSIKTIQLAFGEISPGELSSLFPEAPEEAKPDGPSRDLTLDVPILPQGIQLIDSDLELTIDRIRLQPQDITGFSFKSSIRDGRMESSPLQASFAGARVTGSLAADLRGELPGFDASLRTANVDIGGLLAQLGVAEGFELSAGQLDLALKLRGQTPRSILRNSEVTAGIADGLWRLRDANTGGSLDIAISEGRFTARPGQPITLGLNSRIDQIPASITFETDSLASFAEQKDSLRARLAAKILNTELVFSGEAPRPIRREKLRFELEVRGEDFSDFNELAKISLPPYGPYELTGAFGTRETGYFIEDLEVTVGTSRLTGALELDTAANPPRLGVDLVAPSVQLDDFAVGDWSIAGTPEENESAEAETPRDGEKVRGILTPEVLNSLDAKITVNVQEVLSGEDRLGSGTAVATAGNGRLAIDPLSLEVPGGNVDVGFALEPGEADYGLEARAKIDNLDYGLLARRIDRLSTTGGQISVDLDLSTRGSDPSNLMMESNGHIDFAVWPRDLNAGLFDLWAVNLFTAVLPSLDSQASKVNCLVARFALEDGIMRPTALLVDTSRIQASGDGTIDFKSDRIDFTVAAKPKRPQMFSAQTPVRIQGQFSDFRVGVGSGALIGTVLLMLPRSLAVPFEWIFTENEPPDGKIACQNAWGRTPPPS